MVMVRVIYVDQSAGKITASRLDDLIAEGKIAAFYDSDGWVDVMSELSGMLIDQQNLRERGKKHESAGSKGISQAKRCSTGENE